MDFIEAAFKSVKKQVRQLKPPIVVIIARQIEVEKGRRYLFEERIVGSRRPKSENDALVVIFRRQALEDAFRKTLDREEGEFDDFLVKVGCEDSPGGTALASALHEALSNSRRLL